MRALGRLVDRAIGRVGRLRWPLQPWQSVIALALLAGMALMAEVVSDVWRYRDRELDATRVKSQDIARMLEAHTQQSLRRIELLMRQAANELADTGDPMLADPQSVRRILTSQLPGDRLIRDFALVDQAGRLVVATAAAAAVGPGPLMALDRDYFVQQRDDAKRGMAIGATTLSRLTGALTTPVSLRLNRDGGAFNGVLIGAVDPQHFQGYYDSINRGPRGTVSVLSTSGSALGRAPFHRALLLRDWSNMVLFTEELPKARANTVRVPAPTDGVERIYSYRTVPDYPVVVVVGLSVEDALAAWRTGVQHYAELTLAGLLVLGTLTWLLARQLKTGHAVASALRDSDARWKFAIEGAGDALLDWDIPAGTVYFSPRRNDLLGYQEGELDNSLSTWTQRIHPDDRRRALASARAHLEGRSESFECELRVRCKDGSWKWIHHRGMVVSRDAAGKALRLIGTQRDVSARKHGEDMLAHSQERFKALSDVTFEAVFISAQGICLEQNHQAQHLFGWTAEEAIGRSGIEWIAPADRQRVADNMKSGHEQPYEVLALRKDGSTFPALIKARMMAYKGEPVRVTSLLDVSDIKAAQAESEAMQRRMRATLDALPDLLFEVDADGRILNWHAARTDLLAVPPTDFLGRRYADLLPASVATACDEAVREALASGASRGIQYSLTLAQGTRWFELSAAPMDSGDGQARHVIMLARDITERRAMEDALRQQVLRIEHLSHRLVQAQEEMRRRFASELHDRTSPNLAALRINLDFIASASPERRLGLGYEERVHDTRALIEDTTASIREICADLHPSSLEGAGLVGAVRGYAYQFGRRTGLQVMVVCAHPERRLLPELELALFRIVQEAMTNCAKHARARRLEVTFELSGRPMRVCIADDGVGLSAGLGETSALGSGLGLQTMRETAEFVGGRLSVRPSARGGTLVSVEIDSARLELDA